MALAACMALAGAGLGCGHGPYGILSVGEGVDGTVNAQGLIDGGGTSGLYESHDGGLSWRQIATHYGKSHPLWDDDRKTEAITSRGTYRIVAEGREITPTVGNKSETIYSLDALWDATNETPKRSGRWSDGDQLQSIHYDARNEHVIVAMETRGVAIETLDGHGCVSE